MEVILFIIAITTLSGVLGTGIGGLVGALLQRDSSKTVSLLLAFAAGVMTSVVCFDLIPAGLSAGGEVNNSSIAIVILGTMAGYLAIFILNHLIDKKTNPELAHLNNDHPRTADSPEELIHADHFNMHKEKPGPGSSDLLIAGVVMACAIALHNMPEGMVIGASYAGQSVGLTGSALMVAIIIGLHNIPEGMAVSVPLISGGMKKIRAVIITALSGLPTVLGALLGFLVGSLSPIWLAVSLSFASGAMLYVVLGELLPESILMWKSKAPSFAALMGLLLGIILMN